MGGGTVMSSIGGRDTGARGGGDLLSPVELSELPLDLDCEEDLDLGVLGDLGGVEVGVCGVRRGGESWVGVPVGVLEAALSALSPLSVLSEDKLRLGGSTFIPGAAR